MEDEDNIAKAIWALARAIDRLGTNDAATPMGAIELLAVEVKRVAAAIETGLGDIAGAIENMDPASPNDELRGIGQEMGNGLQQVADAIRYHADEPRPPRRPHGAPL